jgi:thiamine-phosphate pyrophosphorylase
MTLSSSPARFLLAPLYPILDTAVFESRGFDVSAAATVMLDAGVRLLQYRHKLLFTEQRYQEAAQISGMCRAAGALFVMNDRADYAKLLDAGLHVGQEDLPAAAARQVVGPDLPIGLSTHNEQQFRAAMEQPVDYLAFGPIFATSSKANPDPVVGLTELKRLRSLTQKPLVAIGGVSRDNASGVLAHGADSIALISGILPGQNGDLHALEATVKAWLSAVA